MKSAKDAMMPQLTSETYSEGGLSGEAVVERADLKKPTTVDETLDTEPFMLRVRSVQELEDYDQGLGAGSEGKECDSTKSLAWQRGWAEAQE
jgi:hypothetical protein